VTSARSADVDGFAALLGHVIPRRWVPVRPGGHAWTRSARLRSGSGFFRYIAAGPGAGAHQAHRRAMGSWTGRVSAWPAPTGLCRMERPVSRRPAPLLARRYGPAARLRRAARRLE